MSHLTEILHEHLGRFQTAPFLFIGSGISRRYIGSDSWEELLRRFAKYTGKPFEYYKATAMGSMEGIASRIAADFHEQWWNAEEFAESKTRNMSKAVAPSSALKIEISNYLNSLEFDTSASHPYGPELDLFKSVTIDGIITTNYDCLLEKCFPDFKVFIGQDGLLFSSQQHVAEIYKIHGCTTDPNSLILTQEDYDNYNKRNAYLAAKLITIFMEHPIVFIGYSIQDKNIHQLLRSICGCISAENVEKLRDRLIFIERTKEGEREGIEDSTIMIQEEITLPIIRVKANSMLPVFGAMTMVERKFPAKLLRLLKEHVYELVATTDPKHKLFVKDIDGSDADLADCEIVFGVGAIAAVNGIGYRGLTRKDLVLDVLMDGSKYNPRTVIELSVDEIFNNRMKYCPIFKYLRGAGFLTDNGSLEEGCGISDKVRAHVREFSTGTFFQGTALTRVRNTRNQYASFTDMQAAMRPEEVIKIIPGLKQDFVCNDELGAFLLSHIELLDDSVQSTPFCRAVSIYDYRKYLKPTTNVTVVRVN